MGDTTQGGIVLPKDPVERQGELEKHASTAVELLAEELNQGFSEHFLKLLHFQARFRKYSPRNVLLILLQRPDASRVASYKKWAELGWQVRKGAKAIWLYAPVTKREQDAVSGEMVEKIVNWRLVPTFADTDLDGLEDKPLPVLWTPLPGDCQPLVDRAITHLTHQGIAVSFRALKAGLQGMATADKIVLSTRIPDSTNRLATLLHEAAHSMCHFGATAKDKPSAQCELEAEASAWVALHYLGLDYPFSGDYLKSFGIKPDDLRASLTVIGGISKRLLKLVEDEEASQTAA